TFIVVLRNNKVEDCAWAVLAGSPQPASMSLKNRAANGESHSHTSGLGGVERVKDLVYCVRGKTYPRVFNRYLHVACIKIAGRDEQFSRPLIYAAHCFDRIHNQV